MVKEMQVAYRVAERRACRVLGFSRTTCRYRSRRDPRAELRRLRTLEEENSKLKQLVADLSLDKKMLQDVLSKKL